MNLSSESNYLDRLSIDSLPFLLNWFSLLFFLAKSYFINLINNVTLLGIVVLKKLIN